MNLHDYQIKALETDNILWGQDFSADIPLLGVIGELGSVASVLKKWQRDGVSYASFENDLIEELGDVLWYISVVSHHLGIDLTFKNVAKPIIKIYDFKERPFLELYSLCKKVPQLIELREMLKAEAEISFSENQELINSILHNIQNIAYHFDSDLEIIAEYNHEKTHAYWVGETNSSANSFDSDFPGYEQLPRSFNIDFIKSIDGKTLLQMHGVNIGNKLTDNSIIDDGYRFHDVFHLANVATLGWSPVLRRMLNRKRKSSPKIDEVQDGARAAIIEELVVNQIYSHALENNFYRTNDKVDHGLIKSILFLVRDCEVAICKPWEWRYCILEGCRVFSELSAAGHGVLKIDSDKRSLVYVKK